VGPVGTAMPNKLAPLVPQAPFLNPVPVKRLSPVLLLGLFPRTMFIWMCLWYVGVFNRCFFDEKGAPCPFSLLP